MKEITTISGTQVNVLGLGSNPQMDADCIQLAFSRGINYFFFYNLNSTQIVSHVTYLTNHHRNKIVIATGCETRNAIESEAYRLDFCQQLGIDVIDVFYLEYVSPQDDLDKVKSCLNLLAKWKQKGLIRYVGVTTHNRSLAQEILKSSQIDVLMIRYNMAHRQVEQSVLPTAIKKQIPVIAFTATRWGSLLAGHDQWHGEVASAIDCYRFVLQHQAIYLTLTSPKTILELEQNLAVLDSQAMDAEQYCLWQNYGDLIYGDGKDSFETQWQ